MEERVSFFTGDLEIEGLIKKNSSDRGVVVAHPHPQYGGNMFDFVVESTANGFYENGYTTLKFNFRGVGKSQGRFDNGVGEQADLTAAIDFLAGTGIEKIDLAGYSFGTWVISQLDHDALGIKNVVFVSPPVGLMDFGKNVFTRALKLIVTGSLDEFAPPVRIQQYLDQYQSGARLEVIEGSDHFYGGYHYRLETIIKEHIKNGNFT